MHPSWGWSWLRVGGTEKPFVKMNIPVASRNATTPTLRFIDCEKHTRASARTHAKQYAVSAVETRARSHIIRVAASYRDLVSHTARRGIRVTGIAGVAGRAHITYSTRETKHKALFLISIRIYGSTESTRMYGSTDLRIYGCVSIKCHGRSLTGALRPRLVSGTPGSARTGR